jgi:OPA family glycerol-3-phosphate transporter-like MFS transporter
MPAWLSELLPIAALLVVITLVLRRLPKVDLGHSPAFLRRRFANWFPVGLTYAFLYMGRYNLTIATNHIAGVDKEAFGTIFAVGTFTYGCSFVLNGPLTDRFGGRRTILTAAIGSATANLAIGAVVASGWTGALVPVLAVLYAVNMYFQSFGAISIVKVNAAWFHVRERGTFGGIFGILISAGVYFAFDWSRIIIAATKPHTEFAFYVPAVILVTLAAVDYLLVRDTPQLAGLSDFDTADASSGDDGPRLGVLEVAKLMLRSPVIMTIALVEFCTGYLRDSITQWYPKFFKATEITTDLVPMHWGAMLFGAGILGGIVAGVVSDRVFDSRRGPVSAVLYGAMIIGVLVMLAVLRTAALGPVMVLMFMCIIGVHGMLSGTASMDFGGKKNAGVAVGIIDGFVYLGTAAEALVLGHTLPGKGPDKFAENWWTWPAVMVPVAVIGFVLALRLWNAKPKAKAFAH